MKRRQLSTVKPSSGSFLLLTVLPTVTCPNFTADNLGGDCWTQGGRALCYSASSFCFEPSGTASSQRSKLADYTAKCRERYTPSVRGLQITSRSKSERLQSRSCSDVKAITSSCCSQYLQKVLPSATFALLAFSCLFSCVLTATNVSSCQSWFEVLCLRRGTRRLYPCSQSF